MKLLLTAIRMCTLCLRPQICEYVYRLNENKIFVRAKLTLSVVGTEIYSICTLFLMKHSIFSSKLYILKKNMRGISWKYKR